MPEQREKWREGAGRHWLSSARLPERATATNFQSSWNTQSTHFFLGWLGSRVFLAKAKMNCSVSLFMLPQAGSERSLENRLRNLLYRTGQSQTQPHHHGWHCNSMVKQ